MEIGIVLGVSRYAPDGENYWVRVRIPGACTDAAYHCSRVEVIGHIDESQP